jgi:C2 domain
MTSGQPRTTALLAFLTSGFLALSAWSLLACCFLPAPAPGGAAPGTGTGAGTGAVPVPVPPPPPGSEATLLVLQVVLPNNKETGVAWDIGGGAPDPFVVVRQNGITLLSTERVQDTLAARWEPGLVFDRTLPLEIDVYDGDVSNDDAVGSHFVSYAPYPIDQDLTYWGGTLHLEMR